VARPLLIRRVALVGATLLLLPVAASPARAASCADVFPPAFRDALAREFPSQRVTAAVTDTRTGCAYDLGAGLRLTTASVIKAGILGTVLLQAQDRGRGLTEWERARIRPMVQYSHNNPHVSDLYAHVGGVSGMDRADRRWGATGTTNSASYGATWTTARDRTRISLHMLHGGGPLAAAGRSEAWRYMSSVHPTQRWGISAGVPSGWSVALKNGFYPMRGYGWRVGSTGFVRQGGAGGYAVTVLTDGGSSQAQGVRLVEAVSRRVAATLAGGPPAPRSVDRAICTATSSGESWSAVAARVRADPAAVRTVSGGNASPLQGQRACSPTLRP
jgi:beta-lactamase class A